ncbi:acyltransferase [Limosilactobacillus fermentum]
MNKYIKAIFCVPFAGIKYAILKLENGKRFSAAFPAIASPLTEITVEGKSELRIDRKLKMHNGAKIRVRKGGKLEIGKNFGMSNGCVVTAYDHIKIGDNVMLGPNVLIYDQDHDYRAEGGVAAMKFKTAPVVIGNNVWIGANTLILRGTTIGDNSVVGGGTVIKGEYPPNSVIVQKRTTEVIKQHDGANQSIT